MAALEFSLLLALYEPVGRVFESPRAHCNFNYLADFASGRADPFANGFMLAGRWSGRHHLAKLIFGRIVVVLKNGKGLVASNPLLQR
jgi:hypothetical protein